MKSRVMRKLFFGDLLIFLLLLLFQLGFQSFLFEPFLVSEQSKRLTQSMDALQSAIVKGDAAVAHQRIDEGMDRGIVMVAEDQQYHQVFGQPIYQYQQCFTLKDQSGKSYTIVEDYLDSIPLQAMELGDEISVNGYLVDVNQSLVMPSKVYRLKDGAILGVDTFLIIDHPENAPETTSKAETPGEDNEVIHTSGGIMISSDSPPTVTGYQPNSNDGMMAGAGVSISDSSNMIGSTTIQSTGLTTGIDTSTSTDSPVLSAGVVADTPEDENVLPSSFLMHSPFEASDNTNDTNQGGWLTVDGQGSDLRTARILIINSSGRGGDSFPISITGRVTEINSPGNQDLVIQQGLINDEFKRLSSMPVLKEMTQSYTRDNQMTTGKYFMRVVRLAEPNMTLIGSISLYSIKDMNGMINAFHVFLFITELILLVIATYFYSRIIAKPLVAMNDVALKIAHQDFESKVNITTRDEIGMLGQSINTISTNLEHRIMEINAINDRLQMDYERQIELQKRHRELSATFSHELKTPLTIMRGCIDNIQNTSNPAELVEYNSIALHELDRAGNLITQMLEIARMESPYFALHKSEIDLWMIFFKVYDELRQTIEQKGMRVDYNAGDEAFVYADAELLERVISNVMTNAMKYSPRGSVITVEITSTPNEHIFTVLNSNSAISPEEIEKIWQPFYRSRTLGVDSASGTGLGLMIVSSILDAHGFQYAIRNTVGGVEFRFTCPVSETRSGFHEEA
ncbi:MAG: HAMP domain-containing sensor histidine kinase [Candidatus Limiplasma sp.]|nr:HAMP domain-containing sensor histidine kinase [Candidatus Limiplasma sp.]